MKKLNLLTVILLMFNLVHGQHLSVGWVKQDGGNSEDIGFSITSDENYVYNTGIFSDTCLIGDTVLISNGYSAMYVSKYDKQGNFIWAKQFVGNGYFRSTYITTNNGHIYSTGLFTDTAYFDGTPLISNGGQDIFLMDMNSDGSINWVKQFGGAENDQGYSITTDGFNDIYLSGGFRGSLIFDDTILVSKGDYDIFLAKLDIAGNKKWVQHSGGKNTDLGLSVISDKNNDIYLTGPFEDTVVFNGTSLVSLGYQDIYIAKYSKTGNMVWVKQAGGDWGATATSISTDEDNNIYIAGVFGGTAFFENDSIISNGLLDMYIAKYDDYGDLLWVNAYGSAGYDHSFSIASHNGSVYVSCNFYEEAYIEDTVLAQNTSHIFKFSSTGKLMDIIQMGNYYHNECTVDNSGNVYVTGAFNYTQIFGDTTLTNTNGFHYNIFIAKIISNNTGIERIERDLGLKVYPNPFSISTTITFNVPNNMAYNLQLFNIKGQKVLSMKGVTSEKITLHRGRLTDGLYFYRFKLENELVATGKLLIK